MKYKVGDKVRIRSDLETGKRYGDNSFATSMEQFKGKLVTIIDIVCFMDKTFYNIKEDTMNFFWTDEMLECKVFDTLDEFWDDWKNEKVGIKLNNSFEFIDFINNYHYKHFNIDLSTAIEDMNNYTIIKYGRFNDEK